MSTCFGIVMCDYCGKLIMRHDVIFRDHDAIYHSSCWNEMKHREREEQKVKEMQADRDEYYQGGYP